MNIKETFLKLTEYTVPYGHEEILEKYLPTGIKKDSVGNYFIEIGESTTLFTTHLDTYCTDFEKVNHVIDGDIIKTDGKTILGGDNKLGMTILLYMIDKGVPGTYYFFLGEEPILSGGLWGSKNALANDRDYFKKFKRAIAFDRKEKGSVVTRQKARPCCSSDFANALSKALTDNGVESNPDSKAYYTDTATFLDVIPECTNISAGGYREHYKDEWVDLSYTKMVADAACKLDWEALPTNREALDYKPKHSVMPAHRHANRKVVNSIKSILNKYDLLHTNTLEYDTYNSDTLVFNTWFEDLDIKVTVVRDILIQIEGMSDVRFKSSELEEVNFYFGSIFGIDIDPKKYKMTQYTDNTISILGVDFESFDEYIEHFKKINKKSTAYVVKVGGLQYKDYYDDSLNKELVLGWFEKVLG
jgi:hypothetical protein